MRILTYEEVRGIDSAMATASVVDTLQFVVAHPDVRKFRKALEPDMVIELAGSNSATGDEALEHMIECVRGCGRAPHALRGCVGSTALFWPSMAVRCVTSTPS